MKKIFRPKPEATQVPSASAFERNAWLLWGPVVLYMSVIFFVSHQPEVTIPPGLTDKGSHSLAYTLLGLLMVRALAGGLGARVAPRTAFLGILFTTLYGASDEFHQMFVAGRSAELYDLYADATGGAIGAFVCWLWGIISPSWPLKT